MEDKENSDSANVTAVQKKVHEPKTPEWKEAVDKLHEFDQQNQTLRVENLALIDEKNRLSARLAAMQKHADESDALATNMERATKNWKKSIGEILLDLQGDGPNSTPNEPQPNAPATPLTERTSPIGVDFTPTQMLVISPRCHNVQLIDHGKLCSWQNGVFFW